LSGAVGVRTFGGSSIVFSLLILASRIALAVSLAWVASFLGVTPAVAAPAASGVPAGSGGLPQWSSLVSLESAYGFKDNLLLSASGEERSAFAHAAAEVLLLRAPTGPLEYSWFTQVQGRHFFSGRTVHNEASVWVRQEIGFRAGGGWRLVLPVTGYFDDKVFDQSDTEVERLTAELKVTGGLAAPLVQWSFHPDWRLEVQGTAQRESYRDRISDNWTKHAGLRLRWAVATGVEWGASATRRAREFDSRAQYSAAGRELAGTSLAVEEDERAMSLGLKWGRQAAWQATTRAAVMTYRDNGSGYFDHRERQVEQELEWSEGDWLIRLRAEVRRVEFGIQTVGIGLSPTQRVKDEYEGNLRVERKLSTRWTLLGGYTWERARCNDQVASYVVNEGLLGVRWSWEK
jgi:hypothetical protein